MFSTKVHAALVTTSPAAASFYYICRALDRSGAGWIRLTKREAKELMGEIEWGTLKRRAKKSLKEGFLHAIEFGHSYIWAKYKSINAVKQDLCPEGTHASMKVELPDLTKLASLKLNAIKMSLFAQQERCERAINRQTKSSKVVFDPSRGGSHVRGGCIHKTEDTLFVKRHRQCIGASQTTVALKLNLSRQTVLHYCKRIPHVHVYKQQRIDHANDLHKAWPGHFVLTQIKTKTGKKYRTAFRRLPNYYFQDAHVQKEKSPKVTPPTVQTQIDFLQKEEAIKACLARKAPRRTFRDKLIDLSVARLYDLADAILWHWKRIQSPIVRQKDQGDIIEMLDNTYHQFDAPNQKMLTILAKRAKKSGAIIPPLLEKAELLPSCY